MAGVVIIHAPEDSAPAHALATKLRALGHETATDLTAPKLLRGAMSSADAVVALWSPRSTANEDLVAEAAFARGAGRLIHARMHNTPPPGRFAADPSIDLTGWRGDDAFAGWLNLKAAIEGVLLAAEDNAAQDAEASEFAAFGDYEPEPEPAPAQRYVPPPAPRYEEPEGEADAYESEPEPAPERVVRRPMERDNGYAPRAPQRGAEAGYRDRERPAPNYDRERPPGDYDPRRFDERRSEERPKGSPMRMAIIGVITFLVVAGVGIGGYSMMQTSRISADAKAAWTELDKADPLALRAFIDGTPGEFRQPAEAALEELEIEQLGRARETDTIPAYQSFLASFPQTRHSAEISGRMAMLRQREQTGELAVIPAEEEKTPEDGAATTTAEETAAPPAPVEQPELPGGPVLLTPQSDGDAGPGPQELGRRNVSGEDERTREQELRMQIMRGN